LKAIVPAAGIGTRLRPHTHTLPKALLYVAGRPIISHILDEVRELDVSSVVLIVGYKGDLIQEYVDNEYPELKIDYVFQHERKGIGHAVYLTREVADAGEPILMILGDTIIRTDLKRITESKTSALGVKAVEDPRRFGVAELTNGAITKLVEKPSEPKSNLALVGLYYLKDSRLLFDSLQEQIDKDIKNLGEYQITDALQMMIDSGSPFVPFEIDEWFDCGKPDTLLETNRRLLSDKNGALVPDIPGSIVVPPVAIAPTAVVKSSIIGPHVSIAADALVENSIVRDSVLDRGSSVSDCLLEGSIIGAQAVVKGMVKMLNIGDSSEVIFK
jgi:glucose-1-phosphate thymidylyltransferase